MRPLKKTLAWAILRPDGSLVKVYETLREAKDVMSFYKGIKDWYIPRVARVEIKEVTSKKKRK